MRLVPGKGRMTSKIERLIRAEDWPAARLAVRAKLRSCPRDHWLLTRLGLTYYEERRYKQALKYSLRALEEVPNCPLALWDYAGSLEMLGQTEEALKAYLVLVRRGIQQIAFGDCGEGIAWARGLIADCHYRMAHCHTALQRPKMAIKSLKSHIGLRGPGCRSIYSLVEVRKELTGLQVS
jgi:tetratricopeptide (TPR) repeat protein